MKHIALSLLAALATSVPLVATAQEGPQPGSTTVSLEVYEAKYETLKERRLRHIRVLRAYRDAGVFPDNSNLDKPLAVFIDKDGVPCAFANIMMKDGKLALVKQISIVNNNLLVGDLEGGPVVAWIAESGLTHAEAAMIQVPGFMYREPVVPIDPSEPEEPARPVFDKVVEIQKRLDQVIASLEANTPSSLRAATMKSLGATAVAAKANPTDGTVATVVVEPGTWVDFGDDGSLAAR